ncbi:MAG: hypothetical protein U0704_00805 [Candidatus Eisenbacteria bacterium]
MCEPEGSGAAGVHEAVHALGYETVHCPTLDDTLRSVTRTSADAVLVVLNDASDGAVSLLQLLRRAIPGTPLVLVAPGATLETRARCQALRPYYFAVPPMPADELRAVMQGAVSSQHARS